MTDVVGGLAVYNKGRYIEEWPCTEEEIPDRVIVMRDEWSIEGARLFRRILEWHPYQEPDPTP